MEGVVVCRACTLAAAQWGGCLDAGSSVVLFTGRSRVFSDSRAAFEDRVVSGPVLEVDFGLAVRVRFFCRGSQDRVKTKTTEAFRDFCTSLPCASL